MDDAAIEQGLRAFFETRAPEVAAAYLFGSAPAPPVSVVVCYKHADRPRGGPPHAP